MFAGFRSPLAVVVIGVLFLSACGVEEPVTEIENDQSVVPEVAEENPSFARYTPEPCVEDEEDVVRLLPWGDEFLMVHQVSIDPGSELDSVQVLPSLTLCATIIDPVSGQSRPLESLRGYRWTHPSIPGFFPQPEAGLVTLLPLPGFWLFGGNQAEPRPILLDAVTDTLTPLPTEGRWLRASGKAMVNAVRISQEVYVNLNGDESSVSTPFVWSVTTANADGEESTIEYTGETRDPFVNFALVDSADSLIVINGAANFTRFSATGSSTALASERIDLSRPDGQYQATSLSAEGTHALSWFLPLAENNPDELDLTQGKLVLIDLDTQTQQWSIPFNNTSQQTRMPQMSGLHGQLADGSWLITYPGSFLQTFFDVDTSVEFPEDGAVWIVSPDGELVHELPLCDIAASGRIPTQNDGQAFSVPETLHVVSAVAVNDSGVLAVVCDVQTLAAIDDEPGFSDTLTDRYVTFHSLAPGTN